MDKKVLYHWPQVDTDLTHNYQTSQKTFPRQNSLAYFAAASVTEVMTLSLGVCGGDEAKVSMMKSCDADMSDDLPLKRCLQTISLCVKKSPTLIVDTH